MKKVKVKEEYFVDLLDKKPGSNREERKEKGFALLDKRPPWAIKENLWAKTERNYKRKIEGWEKLCVEAYLSGWIDYFDTQVQGLADDKRTIYFEWKEGKKDKHASLKIYLDPSPDELPAPEPPALLAVPKPPPPPVS